MVKKRIMLVEDEAVTAMDLKSSLIELGYEVPAIVSSGEDAVRTINGVRPDLVLMDITLAGQMSGIQAADEIRKSCAIPVVFLTAHADAETISRAKSTEPFGYLPKPCNMDTLMSTIEVSLYKGEADAQRREAEKERARLIIELQEALANVKTLSRMLCICASCKKIRDDKGNWTQLESYISANSETQFSHGICPECEEIARKDLEKFKNGNRLREK